MKFEQCALTKKVMYKGIEVECPIDHTHVATDPSGSVYSFYDEPNFMRHIGEWMPSDSDVVPSFVLIGYSDEISEEESIESLQEI